LGLGPWAFGFWLLAFAFSDPKTRRMLADPEGTAQDVRRFSMRQDADWKNPCVNESPGELCTGKRFSLLRFF
jgi:hypothetical protein